MKKGFISGQNQFASIIWQIFYILWKQYGEKIVFGDKQRKNIASLNMLFAPVN